MQSEPFPKSRKIYVNGSRPEIQVPMREVMQEPTGDGLGSDANPPLRLYDSSGPYTDPNIEINVQHGLHHLRQHWLRER
ncbi:MAG: phosphomethylpyrimidine synthase ThiC, partial [Candidatus Dormibacteraceae bacterium]